MGAVVATTLPAQSPTAYLLDTDTFSALAKESSPAAMQRLQSLREGQVLVSVITLGEVDFGIACRPVRASIAARIAALRSTLTLLPLAVKAASHYASVRAHLHKSGTPIGANDLWIAAHALSEQLTLVTGNEREFNRVPALRVENWLR
jgi:tRNA(fMet)-specific endonuclease VapC